MAELTGTFKLLFERRNWMLVIPPLIAAAVAGILFAITMGIVWGSLMAGAGAAGMMGGGERGPGAMFGAIGFVGILVVIIVALVALAVFFFGHAWAYAAAEPVWRGGDPDLGGGFSKALAKFGSVLVLAVVLGIVLVLLGWTIIVPLLVAFFCCYSVVYIIYGNQSGTGSISASINLAKNNAGPTAILIVSLVVLAFVLGLISAIPFLGWIIGLVGNALLGAFAVLAVLRFYSLLTGAATATPVAAAPPPPPPTTPAT
ncbi:MAG: hypothetical protein JO293_05540 [Candidatus Eremiobacteraeota bacterium]|nr:hypothetical protein [Candidatus Eremiobacteraeota bacterium]